MIGHLVRADFKTMAWANGKGTTVEMLRVERDGVLMLRLSRAMVVEDGPFSLFPEIERSLTVLSGPGFRLVGEGVLLHALPLLPVAFAGHVLVRAEGVTAASEDFNVMTASRLPRPCVWVQDAGLVGAGCAVLALEAGQIGELTVGQYDLVLSDQPLSHDVPVIAVRAEGVQQYLSIASV